MKVIGDLGKYTQFQAAEALAAAANHDGAGIAGMGVGLGAGVGLGQVMSNALNSSLNPNANNASSSSMAGTAEDIAKALEKMHDLLKAGIMTQAEFDAKKSDLLKKM